MPILKNFFQKVRNAIREAFISRDEAIEHGSEEVQRLMMTALRTYAPDGSKNLDQYAGMTGGKNQPYNSRVGQRPSERMGLTPIRDSFTTFFHHSLVSKQVGEGRIYIDTFSDHALYFTRGMPPMYVGGTRPHYVPKSGFQATKGYPLTFHYNGEDRAVWTWTVPKGIKLEKHGDYVEQAWNSIEGEATAIMERAASGIARRMFGRMTE